MNRKDRRKQKYIQNNSLLIREFMHAYNYHEKGMLEEAKLEYKKILLNHPDHFDTIRHLGIVHQSQNDLEKAASLFRTAQKINPLSCEIYNNLGSVLFASFQLKEAVKLFEKSLSIQPNYIPALNNVSLIYYRMRFEKRALKATEKALQLQPDNIRAKTNRALALSINDKLDEAIKIFKDVIKEEPNGANYKNLATALRDSGETEKSFEIISKAIEASPDDEAIFLV